jgi:hypothetical protein
MFARAGQRRVDIGDDTAGNQHQLHVNLFNSCPVTVQPEMPTVDPNTIASQWRLAAGATWPYEENA